MSEEKNKKRQELIDAGLSIYPHEFKRTLDAQSIFSGQVDKNKKYQLAGRIMLMRRMGQAAFFNLQDPTGRCQCYLKVKELSQEDQTFFKYSDIGDIVGLTGSFFQTQKGENTLRVSAFKILCKSTEPLPEKYHGLEDKELRYRYRHLDLVMNQQAREVLLMRSQIIQKIREYMAGRGFIEVDTPVLQSMYGGAMAHPFETHHRALDSKFYLKISPELYLKRVVAGGVEKVFEIGKNFRNEGMDRMHNPEFTMMEYYEAYTDYKQQMENFEDLIIHILQSIHGQMEIEYQGQKLNFSKPWKRLSMIDSVNSQLAVDVEKVSEKELKKLILSKNVPIEDGKSKSEMIIGAFEALVEKDLWQPCFVIDFPKELSPLTKEHREKEALVERFEPFIAGMEIGNAYTELNDPVEQRRRLEQQKHKEGENFHPIDEDFLHAVGVGIPPLGGVGLGIDRLVMLMTNQSSIREVIWFPTLKPKNNNS